MKGSDKMTKEEHEMIKSLKFFQDKEILLIQKRKVNGYYALTRGGEWMINFNPSDDLIENPTEKYQDRLEYFLNADILIPSIQAWEEINMDGEKMCAVISKAAHRSVYEILKDKSFDERSQRKLGKKLGQTLKTFHTSDDKLNDDINWGKDLLTDIDFLLFQHGLYPDDNHKEYLLMDYISANRHILEGKFNDNILFSLSLKNLYIEEKTELFVFYDWAWSRTGDSMYDLLFLNDIAEEFPVFTKAFLDSYFDNQRPSSAFRKFSLYTAVYTLKRLVALSSGEAMYADKEVALEYFNKIIDQYQNFSDVIPVWARY